MPCAWLSIKQSETNKKKMNKQKKRDKDKKVSRLPFLYVHCTVSVDLRPKPKHLKRWISSIE